MIIRGLLLYHLDHHDDEDVGTENVIIFTSCQDFKHFKGEMMDFI